MKNRKRRLEMFSFYDHTGIRAHLEQMAQKGWLLEHMSNFGWVYRRIPPQKLTFFVSYYPRASEFDPEPGEDQKTFIDFCAHTGWKLACTSAQIQIFYNDRENPVPIETDPALEVETIHAAAKKNALPSYIILGILGLLQTFLLVSRILSDPIGLLSSSSTLVSGSAWLILLFLCALETAGYFRWRRKAKKAAEHGEFLDVKGHTRLQQLCMGAVILIFLWWVLSILLTGDSLTKLVMILMVLYMALLIGLVNLMKIQMKKWKISCNINRTVTLVSCFILSFAMMAVIVWLALRAYSSGILEPDARTYEYEGQTRILYADELPLTLEQLTEEQYDGYIRERSGSESPLLADLTMRQQPRLDAEDYALSPSLEYRIVVIKAPFLYSWCQSELLKDLDDSDDTWIPEGYKDLCLPRDPEPWDAGEAYQVVSQEGQPRNTWLLCYPDRLVEIWLDWEPTARQMEIIGKRLGGKSS